MENMTFEDAIKRLEEIAAMLEQGGVPLEQSLKLYEEGSALAAFCAGKLKTAQQKIIELSGADANTVG